jgi:tetratricopeptide (TPR) repeat protein
MNANRLFALTLLGGLLVASVGYSQTQEIQDKVNEKLEQMRAQTRAENVEILRRLLHTSFEASYGLTDASTLGQRKMLGQPNKYFSVDNFGPIYRVSGLGLHSDLAVPGHDGHLLPFPEGVYLKGQGVIYQVTLPPSLTDPVKTQAITDETVPTPWERARSEIRGEKAPTTRAEKTTRPTLSDAILHVLADNGKHFNLLTPDERITVVVTFRNSGQSCAVCHGGKEKGSPGRPFGQEPDPPIRVGEQQPAQAQGGTAELENWLSLGDLHFRQGKHASALQAFTKAAEAREKTLARLTSDKQATRQEKVQALLSLAELYTKVAQCHFAMGDKEAAHKALAKATQYTQDVGQGAEAPGHPDQAVSRMLPQQLVISVPKRLLDEVGSGKITYDQFSRQAGIENRSYPVPEKK